jgi:hypothetical protein
MIETNLIYAVDFDGTLCESCYPEIGKPNKNLIRFLIAEQARGARVILWTCRCGEYLQQAVAWCRLQGLVFDAVNENLPEYIEKFDNDCRKIYADIYIDDKAVSRPCWNVPFKATLEI